MARVNRILRRALRARSLDRPNIRRSLEEAERLTFFRRGIVGGVDDAVLLAKKRAKERGEPHVVAAYDGGTKLVVMPKKRLREFCLGFRRADVIFDTSRRARQG